MDRTGHGFRTRTALLILAAAVLGQAALAAAAADKTKGFFPVSVWYAGGRARAPIFSES